MEEILRDRYLSRARFNRYLQATGFQEGKAKFLYEANLRLAQSFHPIISQFEVALRNSINEILSNHFSDPAWIINQTNGFMNHPSLASSGFFLRDCVRKSQVYFRRQRIPITADNIIADQMFGFWLAFFIPHHYRLVSGQPIYVFPHKPGAEGRAGIHSKLEIIRHFRNRINHCEPICFNDCNIDCSNATSVHSLLFDLVRWMNPSLIPYFKKIDKVPIATELIVRLQGI